MNIIQTLTQLRDDIKTWVTNNLVALNAKIDANTVQIDNELNTSSTNPIQNKPVAERISNINDSDESGEFNLADPSGNVIFKVDAEGIHTTGVEAQSISADGEDFTIADDNGNMIMKVDSDGLHTTDIEARNIDAEDNNLTVCDQSGNVIFKVDSDGLHTTDIETENIDTEDDNLTVADSNGNIIFKVDDDGMHTTDVEVGGASIKEKILEWDAKSNFSGNYEDITNAPSIQEEQDNVFIIADSNGNIIAKIDNNGIHTTDVKLGTVSILENIGRTYYSSGLEYEVLSGDNYQITGIGQCVDVDISFPKWIGANKITAIADDAFKGHSNLTSIVFPYGVTSIGDYAFDYCAGLISVTIGDSVTSIGDYAFRNCINLTDIYYTGSAEEW